MLQSKFKQTIDKIKDNILSNPVRSVFILLMSSWGWVAVSVYFLEHSTANSNIKTLADALWWGIVTMLTVGYGDHYPVTLGGQILATLLMISGVFSIAILTAKVSSYFLTQALKKGRGIMNPNELSNHFIVCGWKKDMDEILNHILDFNPDLKSKNLVIVSNCDFTEVESLRADKRLAHFHHVHGDSASELILKQTAPDRAKKVLILANTYNGNSNERPSEAETDARTIMTAMTLSHIARGTLVAAEILDPKMDQYLKLANVSEIIYSKEYSRLLLGNASGGTGVANIVFDLLNPKTSSLITTKMIDRNWVGKTYSELKVSLETENSHVTVIGVLENTGNTFLIKESAIRKAQKASNVEGLVTGLKKVREIHCNLPVFNPAPNYPIQDGCLAIVVETRMHLSSPENKYAA